ncbi:MAG: Uncharacterised protein [Owenweeksia sp. TMED14]|nr:MAG: Uncharacterised protein [Owenweeksia sp. TMED14]
MVLKKVEGESVKTCPRIRKYMGKEISQEVMKSGADFPLFPLIDI